MGHENHLGLQSPGVGDQASARLGHQLGQIITEVPGHYRPDGAGQRLVDVEILQRALLRVWR